MAFETLIEARELQERLDEIVVVDCRHALADFTLGRKQYAEGHIPGAFFADVERDLAGEHRPDTGRHPMPEPEHFANVLRAFGVDDGTQVVAYDAGADMFAARLWFLCKWIGHDAVAVLDGGIEAWKRAGFPVTQEIAASAQTGSLHVRLRPHLVVDSAFLMRHLDDPAVTIVDARAADRFVGQNETMDPVAGHIPGAANRPFKENFGDDLRFLPADQLRARFAHVPPERVVHQCGSGVSAAVNLLAMERAGLPGSRIYGGGWSEWIIDAGRPVATQEP